MSAPAPCPLTRLQEAQACSTATLVCADAAAACILSASPSGAACAEQAASCDSAVALCAAAAATCKAEGATAGAVAAGVLAFGGACAVDESTLRPIAGSLTFVPSTLSQSPALAAAAVAWAAFTPAAPPSLEELLSGPLRALLFVALHEMCHALGFSASAIPGFPGAHDAASAAAAAEGLGLNLSANVLAMPGERGHDACGVSNTSAIAHNPAACVFKLATPRVAAAAAARFGCAQVGGAELENQVRCSAPGTAARYLTPGWRMLRCRTPRRAPPTAAIGRCASSRTS